MSWIDAYRGADGSLDRAALLEILPYGEDFLFVDRVMTLEAERIEASYRLPADSPILRAHFRDLPVMPGVLTGEGLAQAGSVLVRQHLDDPQDKHLLAMKILSAAFKGVVKPHDELLYRLELLKFGSRMAQLRGEAATRGRIVAELSFMLAIVSREELRQSVSSS